MTVVTERGNTFAFDRKTLSDTKIAKKSKIFFEILQKVIDFFCEMVYNEMQKLL